MGVEVVTVASELRRLFPKGTRPSLAPGSGDVEDPPSIQVFPSAPAEVFAAGAHLLEASGAYQYIVAPFPSEMTAGGFGYPSPNFAPDQAELDRWTALGQEWSTDPIGPAKPIQDLWDVLLRCGDDPLVRTPGGDGPPEWWRACHALLVLADEASGDFGYDRPDSVRWANAAATITLELVTDLRVIPAVGVPQDSRHLSRHVSMDSLAGAVDRHVARVLPKGRTTEIGCTLRTFSHNLALMPPHGRANAYWHQASAIVPDPTPNHLNVLLVPFPYVVPPGSFRGAEGAPDSLGRRWGRFQIDQKWLAPGDPGTSGSTPDSRVAMKRFVDELLSEAGRRGLGPIHGIVFPEVAFDWLAYDEIVRHVRDRWPDVELMVSGVTTDCNGRAGNLAVTSVIRDGDEEGRIAETHSRGKHHRWQLDRSQLEQYGIGSELSPEVTWWERLPVEERVLHINVLRAGSTMTAVICEDLARVDPGLTMLRSLGANLVFALLMDGPQLSSRWPGTYATALADDPGSSVLSLTCAGFVDRSNAARQARKPGASTRRVVALWKNKAGPESGPLGDKVEIELPADHHGVVLQLEGMRAHETAIDGRANSDSTAWYHRAHTPIRLDVDAFVDVNLRWIADPTKSAGAAGTD